MNKTQILKEYDQYTDSWGLIQDNNQQDTSGNGIRYTTEALIVFKKYDLLDNTQRQRFITALDRCELQPGLLMRTPFNSFGYQANDDITSRLTASYLLQDGFAKRFLHYGRTKKITSLETINIDSKYKHINYITYHILKFFNKLNYTYNNLNPDKFYISSWFLRHPSIIAQAKSVSNERLTLLDRFIIAITILINAFNNSSQDGKILTLMFIYSTRRRAGRITKYIAKYWSKRLRKHPIWGQGGIGRVLADYYGREKPSSRYLWGIYGEEPIC